MLKKLLFFAALAIITSSVLAFNIKPATCATVFSQNFDGEPTGSVPQGWTVENAAVCSLTINDAVCYGGSGKSARYEDLASYDGGFAEVAATFEDQHGYLTLSFAIMAENPDYFTFYIDSTDGVYHGPNIYFVPDGYLAYYADGELQHLCPFSINTWYRIRMAIDIQANTYDIYVDDELRAQEAHFRYFGEATYLNRINFGVNSWEKPVGFIDDITILQEERKTPATTITKLTGSLDYLFQEEVRVRIDALVKDAKTMGIVSNATVNLNIYHPNGSLWISATMIENPAGTGIYEWQSAETIQQMNLEKGVYLAHAEAAIGEESPSMDILLFHIDPSIAPEPNSTTPQFYYITLAATLIAATAIGTVLLRRHRKELVKISKIRATARPEI